jgi:hypothetical protein
METRLNPPPPAARLDRPARSGASLPAGGCTVSDARCVISLTCVIPPRPTIIENDDPVPRCTATQAVRPGCAAIEGSSGTIPLTLAGSEMTALSPIAIACPCEQFRALRRDGHVLFEEGRAYV